MSQSQFNLTVTAADKQNIVAFLNRVPTTGLDEAKMLLGYAQLIQNAPPVEAPKQENDSE
jgi:hypothetical protein